LNVLPLSGIRRSEFDVRRSAFLLNRLLVGGLRIHTNRHKSKSEFIRASRAKEFLPNAAITIILFLNNPNILSDSFTSDIIISESFVRP